MVATGVTEPCLPHDISGIERAEHCANLSVEPDDFTNHRVLILGKGNSGFETADALLLGR